MRQEINVTAMVTISCDTDKVAMQDVINCLNRLRSCDLSSVNIVVVPDGMQFAIHQHGFKSNMEADIDVVGVQ